MAGCQAPPVNAPGRADWGFREGVKTVFFAYFASSR